MRLQRPLYVSFVSKAILWDRGRCHCALYMATPFHLWASRREAVDPAACFILYCHLGHELQWDGRSTECTGPRSSNLSPVSVSAVLGSHESSSRRPQTSLFPELQVQTAASVSGEHAQHAQPCCPKDPSAGGFESPAFQFVQPQHSPHQRQEQRPVR
ncbi:hypothetical protein F2P81_018993 [Scophthalmus maximus]|uniref:Uncharacterized protein n=1 Tax=Scophthalmus maximus TaxID=52904 RepID=A0A6A4SC63_SCOMX|nr:hypothetical protein F2P81_018993 [Scophthalmus maximus]